MRFQLKSKWLVFYIFLGIFACFFVLLGFDFNVLKLINHYPDDREYLELQVNKSVSREPQMEIETRLMTVLSEKNLSRPFSNKNLEDLAELKTKGYLLDLPQGKNPVNGRFVSGVKGLWRDERSSFILPTQNLLKINLEIKKETVLSFSMLPLHFSDANANRKIRVWLEDPKKKDAQETLLYQKIYPVYHQSTFSQNSKTGEEDFSEIISKTGWENIQIDLTDYETKEAVLCIEFIDEESQSDSLNFISNPLILKRTPQEKYNVVYLEMDGLSAAQFQDIQLTPYLASKKEEWISFLQMQSISSKPVSSYSGLMLSGLPPFNRHGLNTGKYPDYESKLFYSLIDKGYFNTLPLILKKNGYITGQIGGFPVTHPLENQGFDYGFDESFSFEKKPYDSTGTLSHLIRIIKNSQQKPFFLSVQLNASHFSSSIPPLYYVKAAKEKFSFSDLSFSGKILYLDNAVRLICGALEKSGLLEKTILVITGNHGKYLNQEEFEKKSELMQQKTHVPFLIRLPLSLKNQINAQNNSIPTVLSSLQIAPTILDLLGIAEEKKFTGKSFKKLLTEKNTPAFTEEWVYSFDDYGIAFIYLGRWKYILPLFDGINENKNTEQVYDLIEDPAEKKNIASENADLLKIFRTQSLKMNYWPHVNRVTIFPGLKKQNQEVVLEIQGVPNQDWVLAKFLDADLKAEIQKMGNVLKVKFKMGAHAQFFYWEQFPADVPLTINFFVDGKKANKENLFYGPYSLNSNSPIQLKNKEDVWAYAAFKKPAENPGNSDEINFHYSRIDLRRFWNFNQ